MSDGPFVWAVVTEDGGRYLFDTGETAETDAREAAKGMGLEPECVVRLSDPTAAVLAERERCRRIVERLFAKDWTGNEALALIDRGGL